MGQAPRAAWPSLRTSAASSRGWCWRCWSGRGSAARSVVADLFAAFVPVLPFAFLPLESARTTSLTVTTVLLLLLGIGRGVIGHKNVVVTALQTLAIAAAAAAAGLLVSLLVTGQISG